MPKPLIIVESPTKAKTISRLLGPKFVVESSKGHIRDLPEKGLGIDIENNFELTYEVPAKAVEQIKKLTKLAKETDRIILATDEDREGEAIAWHLSQILPMKGKEQERIVFHEITKSALEHALENPRKIDLRLVDAQQARRVLDRLVGYKLSPLLWKKISMGLSAGRVQSVAVRLIVEREEEIRAFKVDEYWSIEANLLNKNNEPVIAELSKIDGKPLEKLAIANKEAAEKISADLKNKDFIVKSVEKKEVLKKTPPPFTTSTLQQESSKKLGFSAKQTMSLAQKLYEGQKIGEEPQTGLITYMRTDSNNLAVSAVESIREYITKNFSKDYLPSAPKSYLTKSKGAQEAHEAIRPSDIFRTPDSVQEFLDPQMYRLYKLIWERTLACQMTEARVESTGADIIADQYTLRATGNVLVFDGYLNVYKTAMEDKILPPLTDGEKLKLESVNPLQHFTQPPGRFTEATLIKTLEAHGIGRPSTYAPTITTVQARGYVVKKEDKRFAPTDIGELVNKFLVLHFPEIVDINFTAEMEADLDKIAEGEKEWKPLIQKFYGPFAKLLKEKDKEIDKKEFTETKTDEVCELCGSPMVIKVGRFGKFMACSNYPTCKHTKPLPGEEKDAGEVTDKKCKNCDSPMIIKFGRFGKFLACSNYPTCKTTEQIIISLGVACPKCEKGEIIEKKSKRGKIFYACSRYPDCDQAYWNKPYIIDNKPQYCPDCKSLLLEAGKNGIKCSACEYKEKNPNIQLPISNEGSIDS